MKHFTLFNPDANYDFVGRRRVYYALTGIGILVSLVALATMGFNKGIDFKGGTKLIMAFAPEAKVERAKLHEDMNRIVATALGRADAGQVEVQEFDTGSGGSAAKQHFVVITELTSVVTQQRKDALTKSIQAVAGADAVVEWTTEGEDRAYVRLAQPKKILETYAALQKVFKDAGFPTVHPSSDYDVQLDVNLFRQLQMSQIEGGRTPAQLAAEEAQLRDQKLKELQDKSDSSFTVVIEEFKSKLENGTRDKYGKAFIGVESSTAVSPSVAGDMLSQGLVAILYSILGIVLYIILRFDVRYAPGAFVALVHDVILVIGAFSLAQVKFSMPVIAAVLTVAGYSITDTIVVFDRIRESQEKHPGVQIETLINAAINATMSRTVLTSLTTFMIASAIFLFGGGMIRDFAFAMCVGIIVGTFSSVFVAAPIFLALHHRLEKKKGPARTESPVATARA